MCSWGDWASWIDGSAVIGVEEEIMTGVQELPAKK
jgi:hypothetical protein